MSGNQQIDGGAGEINGGGVHGGEERNKQKKPVVGYGRKAKRVVLSRIKRAKKRLQRKKSKENRGSISGNCCCLYIRRIPVVDSSSASPTSDPNCSDFGFDSLRGLIENSDFLLNECNTHLDLDVYSGEDDDDKSDD